MEQLKETNVALNYLTLKYSAQRVYRIGEYQTASSVNECVGHDALAVLLDSII